MVGQLRSDRCRVLLAAVLDIKLGGVNGAFRLGELTTKLYNLVQGNA
jgi:hypothetical protein